MQNKPRKNLKSIIINPFLQFVKIESAGGIILLSCAILAMIAANSPVAQYYYGLFNTRFMIGFEFFNINKPLLLWINDGLMAIFFFVVGLEIKRELLAGELSSFKKAALPGFAAIGGMVIPALIFTFFNYDKESIAGWGVPMATDIAFALGILSLLGKRVPLALKVFLTAFAIIDDLGAVLVIAFFYTSELSTTSLLAAGGLYFILAVGSRKGIKNLFFYIFFGIFLWIAILKSGVHATIAGVLLATVIPMSGGMLKNLEHQLHPWVAFFIMPVFAFANSGVTIEGSLADVFRNEISLGIILGLFFGKMLGIWSFTWLAVKTKIAEMPESVTMNMIFGAGIIGGIGFTMSLFIAGLAYTESAEMLTYAKLGILTGSLISGVIGYYILSVTLSKKQLQPSAEQ